MKRTQFDQRVRNKLNIRFDLSAGAFSGEKLVGFVFHTLNEYNNRLMAYNGGTGVIAGHRGNGLTLKMYEYLFPKLKSAGAQACVLEVITTNTSAIKVYQQLGFEIATHYHCFRLEPGRFVGSKKGKPTNLKIISAHDPIWETYQLFSDTDVSFADTSLQLAYNLNNEQILHAMIGDQMVGYLIFQPVLGRISQIGVQSSARNKGIGTALITSALSMSKTGHLTLINLNSKAKGVFNFLVALGFENQLDQYEMIREL